MIRISNPTDSYQEVSVQLGTGLYTDSRAVNVNPGATDTLDVDPDEIARIDAPDAVTVQTEIPDDVMQGEKVVQTGEVQVVPYNKTSYARNLSAAARTEGIQPGEPIRARAPDPSGGWKRQDLGTAPSEPGIYTATAFGETIQYRVRPMGVGSTTQVDGADADDFVGDASGGDGRGDPLPEEGFYRTDEGELRLTPEATDTTPDSNTTTTQAATRAVGLGPAGLSGATASGLAGVALLLGLAWAVLNGGDN